MEPEIHSIMAESRLAIRRDRSAPLVAEIKAWTRENRAKLSRHAPVAQTMANMLRRWNGYRSASTVVMVQLDF